MGSCDRCCQNAVHEWWNPNGRSRLAMCGHHSREHGPALTAQGFTALPVLDATADQAPPEPANPGGCA